MDRKPHEVEHEPAESQATELARIVADGNPDAMLAHLEKKAALAPRMKAAIEQIMLTQTYPQDWTPQGEGEKAKACLSSAGAERIGRNFPIRYYEVKWTKEEFQDDKGKGYRYVYSGYAELYERTVYAEGSYSTRDDFLGKKAGEWRPLEDINEGDIRSAAHHIFMGNAVKQLLGLRGMPLAEYQRIMAATGQNVGKTNAAVVRGQGAQGGSTDDDARHRSELAKICMSLAQAGMTVERNEKGYWGAVPIADADERTAEVRAAEICVRLSSFKGKDGNEVKGLPIRDLKDKRLSATISTARKVWEYFEKNNPAGASPDGSEPPQQ